MYIYISKDFAAAAQDLARQSGENFNEFKANCFADIKSDGDQITFLGHGIIKGDEVVFGDTELSPTKFVEKLMEYKLPTSIKKINLIGCYLGLSQDKPTYLEETAKKLGEKEKNIKIRGFQYEDKEKKYMNMSMTFSYNQSAVT